MPYIVVIPILTLLSLSIIVYQIQDTRSKLHSIEVLLHLAERRINENYKAFGEICTDMNKLIVTINKIKKEIYTHKKKHRDATKRLIKDAEREARNADRGDSGVLA